MFNRRAVGLAADLLNWPRRADCWHRLSILVAGNALNTSQSSGFIHGFRALQNPPANADSFSNAFQLRPGTYTFSVLGHTDTNRGIVDWYIDDVLVVAGQDWYATPAVNNVVKTATVQVSSVSCWHVLRGVINGKHASSSDYFMSLTTMSFLPSSD